MSITLHDVLIDRSNWYSCHDLRLSRSPTEVVPSHSSIEVAVSLWASTYIMVLRWWWRLISIHHSGFKCTRSSDPCMLAVVSATALVLRVRHALIGAVFCKRVKHTAEISLDNEFENGLSQCVVYI